MKKARLFVVFMLVVLCAGALRAQSSDLGKFRGVWANKNGEAVITDSVMLCFKQDVASGKGTAVLYSPAFGLYKLTDFTSDGVFFGEVPAYRLALTDNGCLTINNDTLSKVEDFETVKPYDMPLVDDRSKVGERLQEWQLGVTVVNSPGILMVTVGTNKNSFMYCINNGMVYLRAATLLHCNEGSLFVQNIRMMKNPNTGEFTNEFFADQLGFLRKLPVIDCSNFQPDRCFFGENSEIYWSYISHTPESIQLNGCGETYNYGRRMKDSALAEWIKYEPVDVEVINSKPDFLK